MEVKYFSGETANDRWVIEHIFNFRRAGYFFEAGACDGGLGSNTLALEKQFGWSGICCEPSREYFSSLQQNRDCICDNSCLSGRNETIDFVEAGGWGGIKTNLNERKKENWEKGATVKKETKTLEQVLDLHKAPTTVDYLSLDLEGSEFDVLRKFNFEKYTFLAITIEGDSCTRLLIDNGYAHVRNPYNTDATWENYYLHKSLFVDEISKRLLGIS